MKDIGGPGETVDDLDSTSLDSGAKESIAGLVEYDELSFEANEIVGDTKQAALRTDARAGTARNYQVVFPEGGGWSFSARVKKVTSKYGTNAVRMLSGTLKVLSAPTPIS